MSATEGPASEKSGLQRDLEPLRRQLDGLDEKLVDLLAQRMGIAEQVRQVKERHLPAGQPKAVLEREDEVLRRVTELAGGRVAPAAIAAIYREIISAMLGLEQPQRIACLGPAGTFSELAARSRFGHSCAIEHRPDIPGIVRAVANSEAHWGLVPLENSFVGPVHETFECLRGQSQVFLCAEVVQPVDLCLLGKEGVELDQVTALYGHEKALQQCRGWARDNLPGARPHPAASNGEAARMAAEAGEPSVAVGPEHAGPAWGLGVLRRGLEDRPGNHTRFGIIGLQPSQPTGRDRTLAVFAVRHQSGGLLRALECFAGQGVNLTMLHSHPSGEKQFDYNFYLEAEGHAQAPPLQTALEDLQQCVSWCKVLGSFPMAGS